MSPEVPEKVAGSISDHLSNWEKITSDPVVLSNVEGVKLIFDETPIQQEIPRQYKFNNLLSGVVDNEIDSLLQKSQKFQTLINVSFLMCSCVKNQMGITE